jgi:hypothetical protein
MKKYEIDVSKFKLITNADGSRMIKNIAIATSIKRDGKDLKIEVDAFTGIPTKPGTLESCWEPVFDPKENLMDCRPPWERKNDAQLSSLNTDERAEYAKTIVKAFEMREPASSLNTDQLIKSWTRYTDEQLTEIYKKPAP